MRFSDKALLPDSPILFSSIYIYIYNYKYLLIIKYFFLPKLSTCKLGMHFSPFASASVPISLNLFLAIKLLSYLTHLNLASSN